MAAVSTARSSSVPQFNLTGPPSIHRKTKDASKEVPGKAFMDLMVANFNKKPTDDSKEIPGKAFMDLMVANFNKVSRTPPSPPPVRGFTENYGSANTLNLGSSIEVVDRSESTHHTYNVYFNNEKIHTTVTHTASVVDEWIQDVYTDFHSKLNKLVVGLDVEWSRIRDINGIRNKVAVLQLCLSRRCLIFQISWCDKIPASLFTFLSCEKYLFVGSGIDGDAQKLWVDHRLSVARTEELGSLAAYKLTRSDEGYRESPLHNAGLKTLARDVLNLELPKRKAIQLSNWENGLLSDEQIEYACLDAFVSFKLAIHLMNRVNPVHGAEPKKFWKDFSEVKKGVDETAKQVPAKTFEATKQVSANTNEAIKQVSAKTNEATKQVPAKTAEATKQVSAETEEATKKIPAKTIEAEAIKHLFAKTDEAIKQVSAKKFPAKTAEQVLAKTIEAKATRTNEATKQDLAKTLEAMKHLFAKTEEATKQIAARAEATKQVSAKTNEAKATMQVSAKTNEVTKQVSEMANGFKTNEPTKQVSAKTIEATKQASEKSEKAIGFKTDEANKKVFAKTIESTKQVSEKAIGFKTNEATKQVSEKSEKAIGSKADEATKQMSEKAIGSKADEATMQTSEKAIETDEATEQVSETEHDFEMVDEYNTPSPPSAGEGWSWTWRSLLRK